MFLISEKSIFKIEAHAAFINRQIDRKTEKYLKKIKRQEERLRKKLAKVNSSVAKELFEGTEEKYRSFSNKIAGGMQQPGRLITEYIPGIDSALSSLKFLKENQALLQKNIPGINQAIKGYESLQEKLKNSDDLKKFIRERKQQLKQTLEQYGLGKYMAKYEKMAWYYTAQVAELKMALHNPQKAEQLVITAVSKIPAFKEFIQSNGLLAGLFGNRSSAATGAQANLAGLQTRAQVQQLIVQQAGGPANMPRVQQSIRNAQQQMAAMQNRFSQWGNTDQDIEMPGFKVNNQKPKSFIRRLEYGASLNTTKGKNFLPTTADIALTLGYKLNDHLVTGIGLNTKTGLGTGFNNIKLSYEGIGGRSYVDWQIPKSKFWLTGGYELNYFSTFKNINELKNTTAWQQSCLFGLTKKIQFKNKGLKIQLLWNALAEKQVPQAPAILYRIVLINK